MPGKSNAWDGQSHTPWLKLTGLAQPWGWPDGRARGLRLFGVLGCGCEGEAMGAKRVALPVGVIARSATSRRCWYAITKSVGAEEASEGRRSGTTLSSGRKCTP